MSRLKKSKLATGQNTRMYFSETIKLVSILQDENFVAWYFDSDIICIVKFILCERKQISWFRFYSTISCAWASRHEWWCPWSTLKDWGLIITGSFLHPSIPDLEFCSKILELIVVYPRVMRISLVLIVWWVENRAFFSHSIQCQELSSWCCHVGYQTLVDYGCFVHKFVSKLLDAPLGSTLFQCFLMWCSSWGVCVGVWNSVAFDAGSHFSLRIKCSSSCSIR